MELGGNAGPGIGYVIETTGGAPRRVCENCEIYQWSRDNRQIFIVEEGAVITRLNLATGARTRVVAASVSATAADAAGAGIDRPLLSPNERWMVFNSRRKVFVAPIYSDRQTPEHEWLTVHSSTGAERSAGLSPDGRLLYLLLERDGFRCLYALRLDPIIGRPAGEPLLVHHFHDSSRQWGSTGFGSATVTGIFVAFLHEASGNIWMTTIGSD